MKAEIKSRILAQTKPLDEIEDREICDEAYREAALELLGPLAAQQELLPEHWVHEWDEGLSFCPICCQKKVEELLAKEPDAEYMVDGGWGTDGDSIAFCETCGKMLSNSLTDYGAQQELEHVLEHGCNLSSPDDCYCLLSAIEVLLWEKHSDLWTGRDAWKQKNHEKRVELLHKTVFRVLRDAVLASPTNPTENEVPNAA